MTEPPGPERYPDPTARSGGMRESVVTGLVALLGLLIAAVVAVLLFVPYSPRR